MPEARRVAVIGVAKNAGKTTALNALIDEVLEHRERVGLLSVGVDGEPFDAISGAAKPAIRVWPGALVCTAERALDAATAGARIVERCGVHTPLGELVIAEATRTGEVLLAGVRHRTDVRWIAHRLAQLGADRVLIDGAFDRLAAADPTTSDSVVVATGMIGATTIDEAAARAAALISRLLLAPAAPSLRPPPDALDRAAAFDGRGWQPDVTPDPRPATPWLAIYLPGLVTDATLSHAARCLSEGGSLIVQDATRVFCSDGALQRFSRTRSLCSHTAIHVAAVTVNPTMTDGDHVDALALLEATAAAVAPIPAVDVVLRRSEVAPVPPRPAAR